jgi:hypothetical protein
MYNVMQRVEIDQKIKCDICHSDLLNVSNIKFTGKTFEEDRCHNEEYICRNCKSPFIISFPIFDKEGHIEPRVFSEDLNDLEDDWRKRFTPAQKKLIEDHLRTCLKCQQSVDEETLQNTFLKIAFQKLRKVKEV